MSFPPRRLLVIVLVTVILLGAAITLGLRKTVTFSIDGRSTEHATFALTVGSFLREMEVPLSPEDSLSPPQDSWLKRDAQVILQRAVPVQVLADGKLHSTTSADRMPSMLLSQAGVNLQPGDLVLSNGYPVDINQPFSPQVKSISLQIVPSVDYTLSVDGKDQQLSSSASSLGSALWTAGHILYAADELFPPPETPLVAGLNALWNPSRQVTVKTHMGDVDVRTSARTVGEALQDAHLSIQGLDYSLPAPSEPLPSNGEIRLVRVTEDVIIEQTPLPFETTYQPVSDLEIDSQSIVQTGEYGLNAQRIRIRYEDGQEISRQVEGQWVARQPLPRIVGYGTQVSMKTAVVDGREIQYWRSLNMYATSYHPSSVGSTTASGMPLQKGVAAVDINYVPFYTQMYVPGYGEAVAADIGGGVRGRWIDLGYSDGDYVPWHQWVTVYFLWPPPANIVWIVP